MTGTAGQGNAKVAQSHGRKSASPGDITRRRCQDTTDGERARHHPVNRQLAASQGLQPRSHRWSKPSFRRTRGTHPVHRNGIAGLYFPRTDTRRSHQLVRATRERYTCGTGATSGSSHVASAGAPAWTPLRPSFLRLGREAFKAHCRHGWVPEGQQCSRLFESSLPAIYTTQEAPP